MQFILSTIVAWLLLCLTATAWKGCYRTGMSWSGIGNDTIIKAAFDDLCSDVAGVYEIGSTVTRCANAEKHRINAAIHLDAGPNDLPSVNLTEAACLNLLYHVKDQCTWRGGQIEISPHFGSSGDKTTRDTDRQPQDGQSDGDADDDGILGAMVMVDPNDGNC